MSIDRVALKAIFAATLSILGTASTFAGQPQSIARMNSEPSCLRAGPVEGIACNGPGMTIGVMNACDHEVKVKICFEMTSGKQTCWSSPGFIKSKEVFTKQECPVTGRYWVTASEIGQSIAKEQPARPKSASIAGTWRMTIYPEAGLRPKNPQTPYKGDLVITEGLAPDTYTGTLSISQGGNFAGRHTFTIKVSGTTVEMKATSHAGRIDESLIEPNDLKLAHSGNSMSGVVRDDDLGQCNGARPVNVCQVELVKQ